jgi:tetratricopeptide (TPR) repeat protein
VSKLRRKVRAAKAAAEADTPTAGLPAAQGDNTALHRWTAPILGIVALLILANVLVYADVIHYGFVYYDDPQYVSDNPNVTAGLTGHGLLWAFNVGYQANWHPLTWLSHMLDVELYGLDAGAHHVTNVLLHIGSTLLLFWILWQMTGASGRSAFVAALFAVHPMHVESVAWIAERKDVLSTFLGMLTICAYLLYVRKPRWTRLLGVEGVFALSLTAKPMLVTLPFLLLLLDYWPLCRISFEPRGNLWCLVREKTVLFILAAASSVVTVIAQQSGGTVVRLGAIPLHDRLENVFITYITYIWKTFWPSRLGVLYTTQRSVLDLWFAAAAGLIGLSILVIWIGRRRPYVPVGWFWYLGTLIPVIGLVQVGRQTMADRYTYVPSIGLYLIIAYGLADAFSGTLARKLAPVAGGLTVLALMVVSRTQVGYWSSSRALWEHTLEIGNADSYAHLGLAYAAEREGKLDEATHEYAEAVNLDPTYPQAQYNLATILAKQDRWGEAGTHYLEAIRLSPADPSIGDTELRMAHYGAGRALADEGRMDEAAEHFAESLRLDPAFPEAHNAFGLVQAKRGNLDEAIKHFSETVRLDPRHVAARANWGILLANQGKTAEAITQFSEILKISPGNRAANDWLNRLSTAEPAAR